jgi:hypothetical protein
MKKLTLLLPFLMLGCAKFPTNITADSTRLIVRMTVKGEIQRNGYIYIIPLRVSTDPNPTGDGPIPVVAFPNANGFVTGNVTHFVSWTPDSREYTLWKFRDGNLIERDPIGIPINTVDVQTGSRNLGFELSLEQLVDTPGTSSQLQSLQVNFLTMSRSLDNGTTAGRIIDALGDTRNILDLNSPIRILLATSRLYTNQDFNFVEPPSDTPANSDCPDPDLDISDWSIEVRRQ